ncbi:MAG: heavy metal translocating P-type ATPase [Alphaproteobacteria bacterium]
MTAIARNLNPGSQRETPSRLADKTTKLELVVTGAHCANCIRKIETSVAGIPGVSAARMNLTTGRLTVEGSPGLDKDAIAAGLSGLGYPSAPFDATDAAAHKDQEGRRLLACLAVAGFASGNIMLFSVGLWTAHGSDMGAATRSFMHWASALIALPATIYAGRPFFASAWRAIRAGHANMDVPISLAVILSLGMSLWETIAGGRYAFFDAAVSLLFLLLIGRYLDHRLRYRAGEAARHLLALQAAPTRRIDAAGRVEAIGAKGVRVGDRLLIAPGDRVPVNAEIVQGKSEFDLALLTGESAPETMGIGATVLSGALNLSGPVVVRAVARADESLAAEIARLIEAGSQSRSRYVRLADKAAALYVPIVHSLAALTLAGWLILGASVRESLLNAIAVLIITCPCALGLAVPAVQIVATGRLFRRGVLVKSGDALERLSEIDTVVFDKTGTLTRGKPRLAPGQTIPPETLELAARLARFSRHPFAKTIAAAAGPGVLADTIEERPGEGILGTIAGIPARLGHRTFVTGDRDRGGMELWFRHGSDEPISFRFEDSLRDDAEETVRKLRSKGLLVVLLSGDTDDPAREAAAALGIDTWRARQTPTQKTEFLKDIARQGRRALMVGDGLNDGPSLANAFVSMSPASAADASQAAADFVLQGERLAPLVETLDVAISARKRVLENFVFAALYNVCAIPLAVLGQVTPFIAAIAMSSSSLIVTLNALRLAGRPRKAP